MLSPQQPAGISMFEATPRGRQEESMERHS